MRKFKVSFWSGNHTQGLDFEIVEANTYDEAIEKVQNMCNFEIEIDEVSDIYDSVILTKKIHIEMADGELYAVPVEPIIDKSIDTTGYQTKDWEDTFYHAKVEKLKYFETHELEIIEIARTIPWKSMKNKAVMIVRRRRVSDEEMAKSWVENVMEVR